MSTVVPDVDASDRAPRAVTAAVEWTRGTRVPREEVAGAWAALYEGRGPSSRPQLSPQEARVLAELAKGYSNKVIAYDLGIGTSTVATLLARAARKLGCADRLALARAGRALAWQAFPVEQDAPGSLTEAESAVVELVLQGLTTAQIAGARGVSKATVSSQLQSIYRKLGVTSRAELACKLG